MLIRRPILKRIAAGEVDLAFRRRLRPTVRPGGRLRTAIGVLAIDRVDPVDAGAVDEHEARRAGYSSPAALLADLPSREASRLYRIALRLDGPDPRLALAAAATLSRGERAALARSAS